MEADGQAARARTGRLLDAIALVTYIVSKPECRQHCLEVVRSGLEPFQAQCKELDPGPLPGSARQTVVTLVLSLLLFDTGDMRGIHSQQDRESRSSPDGNRQPVNVA
jgi:hypothetical protein